VNDWIVPDWPAPARVRALISTRNGGVSAAPFDTLNLATHVGDDPAAVARNRERLRRRARLPAEPHWLEQVHGCAVADLDGSAAPRCADASVTSTPGEVCAVLTADCLPVLLCNREGTRVAAAHAGWRGLAGGVIEATVDAVGAEGRSVLAWLGPAIGPAAFEVGDEVRAAFVAHDPDAATAFVPNGHGRWLADIYRLARRRLDARGVGFVGGGGYCTITEADRFFSYRRDGHTGRMASLIWIQQSP